MIIVGYQGIGKSSLAGVGNCIDLESSNFWIDGKRDPEWYKPYCKIADHLSKQGYIVFTSSHEVVRKELEYCTDEPVWIVFPSVDLKDEWIKKLHKRHERTGLDKDYKAWKNAEDRYEENIFELMVSPLRCYTIKTMDYELDYIVAHLIKLCDIEKRIMSEDK
jgi:hypothetical protein